MKNKLLKISGIGLLVIPVLVGCGNKNNSNSSSGGSLKPSSGSNIPVPIDPEVSGYKSYYPKKVSGSLHNPGMGWVGLEEQTELGKTDLGCNGTIPECDNIGIQTSWDLIEKVEGIYDWSLVDEPIQYWTRLGKRINLRICTDSLTLPEIFFGAPRWLYSDYGVKCFRRGYNTEEDNRIIVTDISDPTYRMYFEKFISALANKYKDNPYVDTIDIRGYGAYGEWHSGYKFDTAAQRLESLQYVIDKYSEQFSQRNKTLLLSCSWEYQDTVKDASADVVSRYWYKDVGGYQRYLANSAFDYAFKTYPNLGFRRDGMAYWDVVYYETDERALYETIRSGKNTVNSAEFYNGYDKYDPTNKSEGSGYDRFSQLANPLEATEELVFKSHCNYSTALGWLNSEVVRIVGLGAEEVFNRGVSKMGYRFAIDQAKIPEGAASNSEIEIFTKLSNSGVGKFPYDGYQLGFMLIDSNNQIKTKTYNADYNLRKLLNGETANVYTRFNVGNIPEGTYTVAAFIADSNGNPSIRLGEVGNYNDRVYPIGTIEIGNYSIEGSNLYTKI